MRTCLRALAALAAVLVSSAAFAVVSATNGILTVSMDNSSGEIGQWTVTTGASHPVPNETVLYPIGTSFITLRDVTAQQYWTNAGGTPPNANIGTYTSLSMQQAPAAASAVAVPNGVQVTYTLPNWTVVDNVVIVGTTINDTSVRHTITVTNTSSGSRQYGVRNFWDWEIAGNDGSFFRTRNPNSAFTGVFQGFNNPSFQAFEEVDNITTPTLSIFGTNSGGSLSPAPTPPDRFGYVSWSDFVDAPWDLAITGSNDDSATVQYWGFAAPLTLAAGASASFVQYISTVPTAIGVPEVQAASVPTLSDAMLAALALVLAFAAWRTMRGRFPRA